MAKINKVLVGESLVGDGNEVAHIDLIMGPRGSSVESAFTHALTNDKDGFTTLLSVVAPNLPFKPNTILGHEFCGTVREVGSRVRGFAPGDRVACETHAVVDPDGPLARAGLYQLDPGRRHPVPRPEPLHPGRPLARLARHALRSRRAGPGRAGGAAGGPAGAALGPAAAFIGPTNAASSRRA